MEYTPFILASLGILGILLHNLVKMDSINRAAAGRINLKQYLLMERFSILISIGFVAGCVAISHEIKELYNAGKWLGAGFFAIGYLAQSILVKMMGKAQKKLNNENN